MRDRETSFGRIFLEYFGERAQRGLALVCGVVLALVLFAVLANPAKAETFTVTNTTDTSDGACDADCSLREAMGAANATAQADTITFASGVSGEILLSNGQLRVESGGGPLRIEGPGADQLAVDGAGSSRVFLVTTGAEAEIAGLTVRNGNATEGGGIFSGGKLTLTNTTVNGNVAGSHGGGIYNNPNGTLTVNSSTISGNNTEFNFGGGIFNSGTLTVNNSTISGNKEGNVNGVGGHNGGGIFNSGTLTVNSSTISDNRAQFGGGIFNSGTLTVNSSTISGNEADVGGGIYNGGTLTVNSSTISGNEADLGGGGIDSFSGTANIENTIVANSTGPNCGGSSPINSQGSNLEDANTCNFNQPSDMPNTDPLLGGLQDNGGPTQTHALQAGSPAIDPEASATATAAATEEPCGVTRDQRGVSRPQDGDNDGTAVCDIGSFEKGLVALNPGSKDYGNQKVATQSAPQTFTVENTGDTTTNFTVSSVSIAGADPGQFTKQNDQCQNATLAPGESCIVEVVFSPNSTEDKNAELQVQSDASSSPNAAQLSGTGTAPSVSLTPTIQDFGNQKIGTDSSPQTFTVQNTGNANLDIGVVGIQGTDPGAFTEQNDQCEGSTVAPGETCTIEVAFSPSSTGAKSAVLRVRSDASSSPDDAQLSGTGTAPGVSLTPTTHDYGNQKEGTQSAPQIFTVENTGDANLDVGTVDIQGAEPGQFKEQSDNCEGNTVAPGESCTVEVVFSPDSAGDKSAVLRVQSDASSSSDAPSSSEASTGFDKTQLSGTGTAVPPAPVPPAPVPPAPTPVPVPPIPVPVPPVIDPPVLTPPSVTNPPRPVNPNACTIKGNNRSNILRGTPRRDVICGFGGNDIIRGLGGNDVIRGGRGNDVIYGQRGNDRLYGGSGNDIIYGQAGRDRLYGQRGNDALFGGRGRDVLFGGPGRDFVNDGVKREVKRSVIDAKKAGEQAKKEARKLVNDVLRQVGIR